MARQQGKADNKKGRTHADPAHDILCATINAGRVGEGRTRRYPRSDSVSTCSPGSSR